MPKKPYKEGDYKVKCDICARIRYRSDCRMQWDNNLVCSDRCYSPKHPNERPLPIVNDNIPVRDARPQLPISRMPQVAVESGTTSWDDSTLLWESKTWIWSDNPSDVSVQSLLMQDPSLDT